MNTKHLSISPEYHCRKAGALFFGIKLDFPTEIYDVQAFA